MYPESITSPPLMTVAVVSKPTPEFVFTDWNVGITAAIPVSLEFEKFACAKAAVKFVGLAPITVTDCPLRKDSAIPESLTICPNVKVLAHVIVNKFETMEAAVMSA